MKIFPSNKIRMTLLLIILAELTSFVAWFFPVMNMLGFVFILLLAIVLCSKDIKYGLSIILVELLIGSQGYLFSLDFGGVKVSLRIGLFLIVMYFTVVEILRNKRIAFFNSKYLYPLLALAVVVVFTVIHGLVSGVGFGNVFFDGNAYLFYAMALPIWQVIGNRKDLLFFVPFLISAVIMTVVKQLFVLYSFSHGFSWIYPELYKWIRDTRVGEIVDITNLFYRVFFQSQILLMLIGLGVLIFIVWRGFKNKKTFWLLCFINCLIFASLFLSFSRSNWLGFMVGLLIFTVLIFTQQLNAFKMVIKTYGLIFLMALSGMAILAVTVLFPIPPINGDFSAGSLFASRALDLKDNAAQSRWILLPVMIEAVSQKAIFGYGFGKELTYNSQDPRVLQNIESGQYTSFTFEWGYLDILLKMGIIGFVIYGYFIFSIIKTDFFYLWKMRKNVKIDQDWYFLLRMTMFAGGFSLLAVHVFSPYINHPIGIGYILLWARINELK